MINVTFDPILLARPNLRLMGLCQVWIESQPQGRWEDVRHVYGSLDVPTLACVVETLILRGATRFCLLVEETPGFPFGTDYLAKELMTTI